MLSRTEEATADPQVPANPEVLARPEVAAPLSPLALTIQSLRGLIVATEQDFNALDAAYHAAPDKARAAAEIVTLFTNRPELCRLATRSSLFRAQHPANVALRLSCLAADYCEGRDKEASDVAAELIKLEDTEFARAIASRAAWASEGLAAEGRAINEALAQFPSSYLLRLHLIMHLINSDQVGLANKHINANRDAIMNDLADEIAPAKENQIDLEQAIAERRLVVPVGKDIYSDEFVRLMWLGYYESFVTRTPRQHGDPAIGSQYDTLVDRLARSADCIVDFGAMCGQWLYDAARKHPKVMFYGSDRQPLIRQMNERAYGLPNLNFRDGDIFDTLREVASLPGRKALIHVRTACVLYPAFVGEFYRFCARDSGISQVAFIEGAGMSRVTFDIADFNDMPVPARVTKHKLYLHDYKRALERAGYRIEHWQRQPTLSLWNGFGAGSYVGSGLIVHASAIS